MVSVVDVGMAMAAEANGSVQTARVTPGLLKPDRGDAVISAGWERLKTGRNRGRVAYARRERGESSLWGHLRGACRTLQAFQTPGMLRLEEENASGSSSRRVVLPLGLQALSPSIRHDRSFEYEGRTASPKT